MKIVVAGAGAMGSLYGGKLKMTGQEVFLADINADHIAAINASGLTLEEASGARTIPVRAGFAGECEEKADLVLFFTKTMHTEAAVQSILHLVHDETIAMTLQNGLGNIELLQSWFPPENIIVGITNFPADFVRPGHIRAVGTGETRIMLVRKNHGFTKLAAIRKAFDEAGFNCSIADDLIPAIWEKVAFNAAMNPLTATTGVTVGLLGESPEGRRLAFEVAEEVLAVAETKNLAVDRKKVFAMMTDAFAGHFDHKPSMLQDVLAKRPTEIDAINGAVVREAEAVGAAAPANAVLFKLVKTKEHAYRR